MSVILKASNLIQLPFLIFIIGDLNALYVAVGNNNIGRLGKEGTAEINFLFSFAAIFISDDGIAIVRQQR